jgi:hypothetical protein
MIEAWYAIIRCVCPIELRLRCGVLTWQELAKALPRTLHGFLAEKYGIECRGANDGIESTGIGCKAHGNWKHDAKHSKQVRPAKVKPQSESLKGWQQIASFLSQPISGTQLWQESGMPVETSINAPD